MAGQEIAQGKKFDLLKFLREAKGEFKKITWPTQKEMIAYTVVVLVTVGFMSGVIWIIDVVLNFFIHLMLGKAA